MKVKQGKEFFFSIGGGALDGTIDYSEHRIFAFNNHAGALKKAKDDASVHGQTNYIFKCTPIYRVSRGRIRVDKLKTD